MIYYNDNDPRAAAWIRELMSAGLIADGEVDERGIEEISSRDGRYAQCHFFAGIGGWPYALRLAGWPDNRPVWTGSCPCQPFSVAGKRTGTRDERHVWPEFRRLIAERRPPTIFGEQVASPAGREWLAGVRADLEALGYVVGAADLCAAGVGAPHVRQRLFWVADAEGARLARGEFAGASGEETGEGARLLGPHGHGAACGLANSDGPGQTWNAEQRALASPADARISGAVGRLVQPLGGGRAAGSLAATASRHGSTAFSAGGDGAWSDFNFIPCGDGKARRIESGTFPLAHGVPGRVGLLRGYGNAIVPQLAAEFVRAYVEASVTSVLADAISEDSVAKGK